MQSKKTNAEFAELVDKTIAQKHVEARKRKREGTDGSSNQGKHWVDTKHICFLLVFNSIILDIENSENSDSRNAMKRKFRQNAILAVQHGENDAKLFNKKLIQNVFSKSE